MTHMHSMFFPHMYMYTCTVQQLILMINTMHSIVLIIKNKLAKYFILTAIKFNTDKKFDKKQPRH